jgi:hypothetical protein
VPPKKVATKDEAEQAAPKAQAGSGNRKARVQSDFPKATLEDAIRIAAAIEDLNAGRPYPPTDVAIALDMSPGSSGWRVLTSASFKYGLTKGSFNSERLEVTELGQRIVSPRSEEERAAAIYEAALQPPTFRNVFQHLKGKKLPPSVNFQNTLVRDFEVPKEHAEIGVEISRRTLSTAALLARPRMGNGSQPSRRVLS